MNQEPAKPGSQTPRWKKFLFGLIPLGALLLGVEGYFRIFPPHQQQVLTRAGFVEPDPELIWRLHPYSEGILKTNELGFRDGRFNADADVRVLLLGDSVSWGDGINDPAQVFPQRAEAMLTEVLAPVTVEIVNASVPGYSTFQHARYLETRGLELNPDLVVVSFCLNDVVERYWTLASYGGDNRFLGVDTRAGIPGISGWAVRHSRACEALMRWLRTRSRDRQEYQVEKMATDDVSQEIEDAWSLVLAELDSMVVASNQRNIPLVLLIAPYQFQLAEPAAVSQPQNRLKEWADMHRTPVIDLLPVFVEADARGSRPLFNDANHFSIAGHELAATELASAIDRAVAHGGVSADQPL